MRLLLDSTVHGLAIFAIHRYAWSQWRFLGRIFHADP